MTTIAQVLGGCFAEQQARLAESTWRRYEQVIWLRLSGHFDDPTQMRLRCQTFLGELGPERWLRPRRGSRRGAG